MPFASLYSTSWNFSPLMMMVRDVNRKFDLHTFFHAVCFFVFNQGKISHVDDDNLLVSTGGGQNGSPFIFIHMLSIAGRSSALNQGSAFCLPPRGPWIRASFLPSSSTYLAERTNRSSSWNFSPLMMMVRDAQSIIRCGDDDGCVSSLW